MKLTLEGIRDKESWEKAGFIMPHYDVEAAAAKAKAAPRWVHFGIGNIFRVFIGGIADDLLNAGELDRGLTCMETFDYDVVDKIYTPYDCLGISVILKGDGTRENRVLGSMAEAVKADAGNAEAWKRVKEIAVSPDLQIISFTITEKGYALRDSAGAYTAQAAEDIENGPDKCTSAMAIVTAMLKARCDAGRLPLALVSMDNCSGNGDLLKEAVLTVAGEWVKRGFAGEEFLSYLQDPSCIAFPVTMIDKITPRPGTAIASDLEKMGAENMQPVITSKRTYIAPFINAEGPQYLVIEDKFPNGRPDLTKGHGVYLADRETVGKAERMKVTVCLNPVHSALGPFEVVLGIDLFAEGLKAPELLKLGRMVAYTEGMPVVADPGIISPQAFVDELFEDRFPNIYLGDTNLRLSTDVSQGVGVRFGETIKSYVKKDGSAAALTAIPFGIAGWLRYMMGIDDMGQAYELAPDPMNEEITEALKTVRFGEPSSLTDQLRPILSNERVFFIDLYKAGIGEKIEGIFREMIAGKGSARAALHKYMQ